MSPARTIVRLGAGLALVAGLALAPAMPASAHDELVRSDPAADASLAAAPTTVTLEFSDEVLTVGAVVVVADAAGTDWVDGDLEIREGSVVARLKDGVPDAGYEVRWRVVSADGHPISGLIPFTVGDAAPLAHEPASEATTDETDADATAAPPGATTQITQEGGIPRVVLIGGIGAAVAAAGLAAFTLIRRRATVADGTGSDLHQADPEARKEHL